VPRRFVSSVLALALLSIVSPAAHPGGSGTAVGTRAVPGPSSPALAVAKTSKNPCKDGAHSTAGTVWKQKVRWRFAASTVPDGLSRRAVLDRLARAAHNIVAGRNTCKLSDQISATERYLGHTTAKPNISSDGACGATDGKNVLGFGKLPMEDLALTCWWTVGGHTVESDMLLNSEYGWTVHPASDCEDSWSVEGVATHEWGHVFGIAHVAEATHPLLTMSPGILPCQNSEATLGLGDVRALRSLY